jgi:predicted RNase H-like HicB family nuclease
VEALAVVNNQNLEYPVLVASEEDNVNEYKSFFSIVLDYPQILGQGETKEYSLRQATRLMHVAFGSMLLKGESIPPPTSGSALEVIIMPRTFCRSDHHGIRKWSPLSLLFLLLL